MTNIFKFLPKEIEAYIYEFLPETPFGVVLNDTILTKRVKQIENGLNDKKVYIDTTDDEIIFKNDADNSSVYYYNIPRAIPFFYTNEIRIFTKPLNLLTEIEQSKRIHPFTFTKSQLKMVKRAMKIIKILYEPMPKADPYEREYRRMKRQNITMFEATNHLTNFIEYTDIYDKNEEQTSNIIIFIALILSGYKCCNTKIELPPPTQFFNRYLKEFRFNAKLKDKYINGENDDLYTHRKIQLMNEKIKLFIYYAGYKNELIFRKLTPEQYEKIKNYTYYELIYFTLITDEQRKEFLNDSTKTDIRRFLISDLNYTSDEIINVIESLNELDPDLTDGLDENVL